MSNKITIEQRVGDAILQKPKEVAINGRSFTVAPPSMATLILASEAIATLPQVQLDKSKIVTDVLYAAKDCRPLGDILAIMILGSKNLTETKRRFFGLFKQKIDRKAELANWLLNELDPAGMNKLFFELVKDFQLGDFFGTTTFLIEINLLRPTKVVETTAFGQ